MNASLRGWTGYFHYRNSSGVLEKVKTHAEECLRKHLMKRHKVKDRGIGLGQFPSQQLYAKYGLYKVPTKAGWSLGVKNIGKPCALIAHAPFDEGGQARACSLLYPSFPANVGIIRHAALNIIRQAQKKRLSIKHMRKAAGWDDSVLTDILAQVF